MTSTQVPIYTDTVKKYKDVVELFTERRSKDSHCYRYFDKAKPYKNLAFIKTIKLNRVNSMQTRLDFSKFPKNTVFKNLRLLTKDSTSITTVQFEINGNTLDVVYINKLLMPLQCITLDKESHRRFQYNMCDILKPLPLPISIIKIICSFVIDETVIPMGPFITGIRYCPHHDIYINFDGTSNEKPIFLLDVYEGEVKDKVVQNILVKRSDYNYLSTLRGIISYIIIETDYTGNIWLLTHVDQYADHNPPHVLELKLKDCGNYPGARVLTLKHIEYDGVFLSNSGSVVLCDDYGNKIIYSNYTVIENYSAETDTFYNSEIHY